ncbi:MAG: hypothetical protein MK102_16860 [Fuerstiella sp.]|nr:hypothetical protein [Fuerstiella sp.]
MIPTNRALLRWQGNDEFSDGDLNRSAAYRQLAIVATLSVARRATHSPWMITRSVNCDSDCDLPGHESGDLPGWNRGRSMLSRQDSVDWYVSAG